MKPKKYQVLYEHNFLYKYLTERYGEIKKFYVDEIEDSKFAQFGKLTWIVFKYPFDRYVFTYYFKTKMIHTGKGNGYGDTKMIIVFDIKNKKFIYDYPDWFDFNCDELNKEYNNNLRTLKLERIINGS